MHGTTVARVRLGISDMEAPLGADSTTNHGRRSTLRLEPTPGAPIVSAHRMDSFARWLVRHPLLVIASNFAITIVLGLFALKVRIESGVETVIPPNDPEITYYEEVRKTFGSDDVAVVGVLAPPGKNVFEKSTLLKIAKLSDELAKLPGVIQVISITNAIDPAADLLNPPKLLPSMPPLQGEIDDLKKKLAAI